jgi:serine O-acetyltransferase
MCENASKFIVSNLDKTFCNVPTHGFNIIEASLNEAIRQTMIDANVKYSGKQFFNDWCTLQYFIDQDPALEAIFLYRLERQIFLTESDSIILPYLASMMKRRTGSELYYSTQIGSGFNVQHGFGIVVGPRYQIGDNFTIHQGVTLGQKNLNSPNERIIIGNNVTLFANSVVLGNVKIGNNVKLGANSVLLTDAIENGIYVGAPAKLKLII